MNSVFSGLDSVKPTQEASKQYFLPGRYLVRLENVLVHKKRLGGYLFVAETTVLESNNPEIPLGDSRNWVQPMDMDAALPRIKSFVGAAKGLDPKRQMDRITEEVTQELCEEVVSESNIFKGVVLELECFNKRSMRTGKDFTIHTWCPKKQEDNVTQK